MAGTFCDPVPVPVLPYAAPVSPSAASTLHRTVQLYLLCIASPPPLCPLHPCTVPLHIHHKISTAPSIKPTMTTDLPQQPTSQHEPTNTLALLLPHPTLFAPPVLDLLRAHYAHFGRIAHWAPVKGFGRVIVVFETEEEAENAKRQGDWLKLDVPVGGEEKVDGETKLKEAEYVERSGRSVVK